MADYDIVIAGGGHNALVCGSVLARAGLSVLVAERNPWVGGGVITREVTLPGFKHDLYGSSHVWIHANETFNELKPELEQYGLKYIWAEDHITGHPNKEGPGIVVYKSIEKTVESISQYSRNFIRSGLVSTPKSTNTAGHKSRTSKMNGMRRRRLMSSAEKTEKNAGELTMSTSARPARGRPSSTALSIKLR